MPIEHEYGNPDKQNILRPKVEPKEKEKPEIKKESPPTDDDEPKAA